MGKILVVDDEINMQYVLSAMLKKEGLEVCTASDGVEALKILKDERVSVVVTDLKMPRLDGMELFAEVAKEYPNIPVIIITAYGTVATAVDALKRGAFDYITKPFDQEEIKNVVFKAIKTARLREEEMYSSPDDLEKEGIMGLSSKMKEVYEAIEQVAPTKTSVIIFGETGTGKELVAGAIHRRSDRKTAPFVKINCAAIAENLVESELFGYEKGAFTGAVMTKPGKFELAHRGTLFLDEVGELPKEMQVKLLRVLQEQEFERVGGIRTIKVDVRLIAATNRDLPKDVREGRFREDLFYRLNVFPIVIPPLRERKEDIEPLVAFFIKRFNKKLKKNIRGISPPLLKYFHNYDWPGNVRELENLIERLVLITKGEELTIEELPEDLVRKFRHTPVRLSPLGESPVKELIKSQKEEVERQLIVKVLEECDWNVTKAAANLGLSRKGLQLKMIKYHLRK